MTILGKVSVVELGFHTFLIIFFDNNSLNIFNPINIKFPTIVEDRDWLKTFAYPRHDVTINIESIIIVILLIWILTYRVIQKKTDLKM